nr:DUF4255 domain-containing protein [Paenibacillus nuruki]
MVKLLRDQLTPDPIAESASIGLSSPIEDSELIISVYLYEIRQSKEYQIYDMISRGNDLLQYPPLSLELSYLITVHSAADASVRALDSNRIMGHILQTMHDHAILSGTDLVGTLRDHNEELRIIFEDFPSEKLLSFFPQKPYKLSISYSVGPVLIESKRTKKVARILESDIRTQTREGYP